MVEQTTPQENVTLEQTQQTDRLPGIDNQKEKNQVQQRNAQGNSGGNVQAAAHTLN